MGEVCDQLRGHLKAQSHLDRVWYSEDAPLERRIEVEQLLDEMNAIKFQVRLERAILCFLLMAHVNGSFLHDQRDLWACSSNLVLCAQWVKQI
jgi:hypothetical protein